ncbi:hypothetical protein LshimejAT787_1400230 [Lyophyllum shimeji]|uniref:Uncharacterized protein n=1 Tax=Lyophyllum shimeji TaxID=47721 RepID=A0A9P3UUV5_LYOSH|nr:hypothetical protein LshimejAT787_1400230 [Lyophyllum shimeji]
MLPLYSFDAAVILGRCQGRRRTIGAKTASRIRKSARINMHSEERRLPDTTEAIARWLDIAARVYEEQTAAILADGSRAQGTESHSTYLHLLRAEAIIAARRSLRLLHETPISIAERRALQQEAIGIVTSLLTDTTPSLRPHRRGLHQEEVFSRSSGRSPG